MTNYTIIKAQDIVPTEDINPFADFINYPAKAINEAGEYIDNPQSRLDYVLEKFKEHVAQFKAAYLISQIQAQFDAEKAEAIDAAKIRIAAPITVTVETADG